MKMGAAIFATSHALKIAWFWNIGGFGGAAFRENIKAFRVFLLGTPLATVSQTMNRPK